MTSKIERGYQYDTDTIKGTCTEDGGDLVDVPHMINSVQVTPEQREAFNAGLWGIAFCPRGRHFTTWTLPPYENRIGATEDNPLADLSPERIDKLPDEA